MSNNIKRIGSLEKKYVNDVLNRAFSTSQNSLYTNKLEKEFAQKFGVNYAISHCNGTSTLHTALASLGVGIGDEVIVPPLTMASTSLAVLQNNSIPIFVDVEKDSFCIDANKIEDAITPKTKCIISVSLYGASPDYDALLAVCKKHDLFLIEDNAECFLGEYKNKLVGTFGDFSSFSFQASKHLTCGEGGMLITNNINFANKARQFNTLGYSGVSATKGKISRDNIQNPQYSRHIGFGFNYRMSELQAAVALGQLERAEELILQRIKVADLFTSVIKDYGNNILTLQNTSYNCKNTYWTVAAVLNTTTPQKDWYKFRDLFKKNGGDGFYASWKLNYNEPYFQNIVQKINGVWQKYNSSLCPVAEFLQPRMIQFKANYFNWNEAEKQADILKKTLKEFI